MMLGQYILIFLAFVSFQIYECRAETDNNYNAMIGLIIEYSYTNLNGSFRVETGNIFQPEFKDPVSKSVQIGILLENSFFDFIGIDNLFTTSLIFAHSTFNMSSDCGCEKVYYVNTRNGELDSFEVNTLHELNITYSTLKLDILFNIKLFSDDFSFYLGPIFSYAITNKDEQRISILEPKGIMFSDVKDWKDEIPRDYQSTNSNNVLIKNKYPRKLKNFSIFLKSGIFYDIIISDFIISPNVSIEFPIMNLEYLPKSTNIWIVRKNFGIDFKYKL